MALVVRPLERVDFETLSALDRCHVEAYGSEPLVSEAALGFYQRSGHAFVVERDGEAVGFTLGSALWNGQHATVVVTRLAVADQGDFEALDALFAAVTKSAYDAGVYRLELRFDTGADGAIDRGLDHGYRRAETTLLARTLGSREG